MKKSIDSRERERERGYIIYTSQRPHKTISHWQKCQWLIVMNSDVYRRELLVRDELLLLLLLREFELELREEVLEELPDELLLREFDTELLDELFDDELLREFDIEPLVRLVETELLLRLLDTAPLLFRELELEALRLALLELRD